MPRKIFISPILVPILLFFLSSVVNLSTSCCEKRERVSTLVDAAIELISKVKSVDISCPDDPEEPKEPERPEEKGNTTYGKPLDCSDLYRKGFKKNGVYAIWPISRVIPAKSLNVYCDMEGGGWTVIQRRGDFGKPADFFNQDWATYKKGFGDIKTDFWLGNDNIVAITNQRQYSVRFELEDTQKNKPYAQYDSFWIDDEFHKYTLHIDGYKGTAGDSMENHNNQKFSTKDQDNTLKGVNCGVEYSSGWWFNECYKVNLNGNYNNKTHGIHWNGWKQFEPLPRVEIKIKPSNF